MKSNSKTVYFVSVIRSMDSNANSTHIMTTSLIDGIKKNGHKLFFLAICEFTEEMQKIKEEYEGIADIVIPLHSGFGPNLGKYKQLELILYHSISVQFYRKEIKKVIETVDSKPDLIITHSPSFESVCYGRVLKEMFPNSPWYQYWSDPIALSGITPEHLNFKRLPFKWAEHRAFTYADQIIFGTKTLMQFQRDLYLDLAEKMRYIDIPYVEKTGGLGELSMKNSLLYAGNYHSNLRNLCPLVDAVAQMPDYTLDIYGNGDCPNPGLSNICFHGRVSPEKLKEIENRVACTVCVLNHSCIQIPGKIFYDTIKPTKILVIVDGPYRERISEYLKSFNRFVFCNNNVDDIKRAIQEIDCFQTDLERVRACFSPEKIADDLLSGGIKG